MPDRKEIHVSSNPHQPWLPTAAIVANLADVRERMLAAAQRADRSPATVTLIAVTKTVAPAVIAIAQQAGVTRFGENRVQEAQPKVAALPDAQWDLIGTLQRNKARAAVALFRCIHSVDSLALAQAIDHAAAERDIIMPVLLQVNVAQEATKHGIAPTDALDIARQMTRLPHLRGIGLMTIAPQTTDPEQARPVFAALRALRDHLNTNVDASWQELSMGMTNDFTVAIEEGATLVRVGRAIFGARPSTQAM